MSACARCDERPATEARGLCTRCYSMCAKKHILHRYPLLPGQRITPSGSLTCVCERPTRQRIPWFVDAWQCGKCGRPFLSDLTRDTAPRVSAQGG